jgi:hypothetical protein
MYIEKVPNRNSPPAVLLRESYREGKKVKKRTLANLSKLPDEVVDNLRLSLKGASVVNQEELPELCKVLRSLPHGHVVAVLGTINNGSLILYDLTSTYVEGTKCSLAAYGYSRDKKKGKQQIVVGILCNHKGCPIAVEVFEGNSLDHKTLGQQISKVQQRFGISQVVWVGDRGTITNANILDELKAKEGADWITALTKSQIRKLAEVEQIQLGLFDEQNVIEIESDDYPGERLIACRNPLIAEKHAQVREELLLATAKELDKIEQATTREKRALDLEELLRYQPSAIAKQKAANKRNQENLPVHSFSTLLADLATIAHNKIQINLQGEKVTFDKITQPTALQQKALDLPFSKPS